MDSLDLVLVHCKYNRTLTLDDEQVWLVSALLLVCFPLRRFIERHSLPPLRVHFISLGGGPRELQPTRHQPNINQTPTRHQHQHRHQPNSMSCKQCGPCRAMTTHCPQCKGPLDFNEGMQRNKEDLLRAAREAEPIEVAEPRYLAEERALDMDPMGEICRPPTRCERLMYQCNML